MAQRKTCPICRGHAHPLAQFCKRCKKLLDRVDSRSGAKPNRAARIAALAEAWDGEGFRCHYSGARLVETDHGHPRYLTFDHRIPRQEDDVVVCAACLNDMKSDLTEDEFKAVVLQLASRFSGGPFDDHVLDLKHWKRGSAAIRTGAST